MKTMLKQYMYLLLFVFASVAGFLFAVSSSTVVSATVHKSVHRVHKPKKWRQQQVGVASWYGCGNHTKWCPWGDDHTEGKLTASGTIFKTYKHFCASWYYPLGTWVIVKNLQTHKSTACKIVDRGPLLELHRSLDVSHMVKESIGMKGLAKVAIYTTIKPRLASNAF